MQLGGSLADDADPTSPSERDPCDEIPSPDLIERAGARGETVLVALDDPAVSVQACKRHAPSGLRRARSHEPSRCGRVRSCSQRTIHLLVADLATPRVRGREFVRSMKTILPGLKSLFVSCQRYGSLAERRVFESGARLLHEPFTPEELAHALRRALESAQER